MLLYGNDECFSDGRMHLNMKKTWKTRRSQGRGRGGGGQQEEWILEEFNAGLSSTETVSQCQSQADTGRGLRVASAPVSADTSATVTETGHGATICPEITTSSFSENRRKENET